MTKPFLLSTISVMIACVDKGGIIKLPRKNTTTYKTRRGNNEGSIYQRPDGRWCAQVTIGYKEDGKANRKTFYGISRVEVSKKMSEAVNTVFVNGYYTETEAPRICSEYMHDWLFIYKRPTIHSRTFEKYVRQMRLYANPAFGNLTPDQVTTNLLQVQLNSMMDKGMALDTIKKYKYFLNQFFSYLLNDVSVIKTNPMLKTTVSTKERKEISQHEDDYLALSEEQRIQIINALETHTTLKPIILTMMFAGLRVGEVLALKWRNVDLKKRELFIEDSTTIFNKIDVEGNILSRKTAISNTKTCASVRSIQMPKILMDTMMEWYKIRERMQKEKGIPFTAPESLVFSTDAGALRTYSGIRSTFNRFMKKHHLDNSNIHFHTFRHTFATMLFEQGESPKVVQLLMGHKDVETTLNIYTHVSKKMFDVASSKLDASYVKYREEAATRC